MRGPFPFFSTFLISLPRRVTKEPYCRAVDRHGNLKSTLATTHVRNGGVNGRRRDTIDSIEIHGETNSWLRAVREIRDNSRNIRDPVSQKRREQAEAPKALLHFIYRVYSRYAIITRSSYICTSVNCATRAEVHRRYLRTSVSSPLSNAPSILCHFDQTRAITSPLDFKMELFATPDPASRDREARRQFCSAWKKIKSFNSCL